MRVSALVGREVWTLYSWGDDFTTCWFFHFGNGGILVSFRGEKQPVHLGIYNQRVRPKKLFSAVKFFRCVVLVGPVCELFFNCWLKAPLGSLPPSL